MSISRAGIVLALLAVFGCRVAHADVTSDDEYMRRLQVHQTLAPLGGAPFGEQINPYTGELGFRQTDLVFEGTGPTIQLVREFDTAQHTERAIGPSNLGDWTLSIPRLETLTSGPSNTGPITNPGDYWYVGVEQSTARCTDFRRPSFITNIFSLRLTSQAYSKSPKRDAGDCKYHSITSSAATSAGKTAYLPNAAAMCAERRWTKVRTCAARSFSASSN